MMFCPKCKRVVPWEKVTTQKSCGLCMEEMSTDAAGAPLLIRDTPTGNPEAEDYMTRQPMIDYAADILTTRIDRGLTQEEAAAELSVTPNTVARWERGELGIHPLRRPLIEAWISRE